MVFHRVVMVLHRVAMVFHRVGMVLSIYWCPTVSGGTSIWSIFVWGAPYPTAES
jgi:hypothetical protein